MSLDYSTYLGPYFECKVGKRKNTLQFKSCPNSQCEKQNKAVSDVVHFCPSCGTRIAPAQGPEIEIEEVNTWEVSDALRQGLWCCGRKEQMHLWRSNRSDRKVGISFDPTEDSFIEAIDPDRRSDELRKFVSLFSEEHKILCQFYGEENVAVRWGLINYIW